MQKFVRLNTIQLKLFLKKILRNNSFQVGAIDELKDFHFPVIAIVNNQPKHLSGEHWLAIYCKKPESVIEIFDSAGGIVKDYLKYVSDFVKKHRLQVQKNVHILQPLDSVLCGYFCLYFLSLKSKGYSFNSILKRFKPNNLEYNAIMVKNYFSKYKFPNVNRMNLKHNSLCNIESSDFSSICIQKNKKLVKV